MNNPIEDKINKALEEYTLHTVAAVSLFMGSELTSASILEYDAKLRVEVEKFRASVHEALTAPLGNKRCIMHDNDAQCCRFILEPQESDNANSQG